MNQVQDKIPNQTPTHLSLSVVTFIAVIITSLFVSACGTSLVSLGPPQQNPEEHQIQASRYIALAKSTPSNAYEYRLRAADHYLKAAQTQQAKDIIRDLQTTESNLDMQSRTSLLEARLALLNKDSHRAEVMLGLLLAPFASNPHLANAPENKPGQKIALLLPSQGPHAAAAKTIRDGFLAAYYKTLQHSPSDPRVQVYDTGHGNDVDSAYRQALAEKADFIVGPLTKSEVQAIAGIKLDIPVLALNSIQDAGNLNKKSGNLYQFGLMPEDEIASTIENARRRGHKNAMIIAPNNDWGKRNSDTFQQLWTYKGGKISTIISINAKEDLIAQLENALNINKQNKSSKAGKASHSSNKSAQSYQTADMIFLVASPELARQLKPLITHYQKNPLPIYATSSIYSGNPDPKYDQDLNGIHFCDMPWVINQSVEQQANKNLLADIWPSSPQNPRYFALGMDAYNLAAQLAQAGLPLSGTPGMTGRLHKDGQRIQRQLVCAKFEKGVPIPD